MTRFHDDLETRSADRRAADLARALPRQIARAKALPGYGETLAGIDPEAITGPEDLAGLPVLRKADLSRAQAARPPLGGLAARGASDGPLSDRLRHRRRRHRAELLFLSPRARRHDL